jgi:osmotically-inducible protein OsmY
MGLIVGVAGGALAAILLAPRRKNGAGSRRSAAVADAVLDFAHVAAEGGRSVLGWVSSVQPSSGLLPDERLTLRIRSELEDRGIWTTRLDVTTVDGTVYLRGREPDPARVDTIVGMVRAVPGVTEVIDEIHRE